MTTSTQALNARGRARGRRLEAARARRLALDPERVAREQRIDEAVVELEVAWEDRAARQAEVEQSERRAAAAVHVLLDANVTASDVRQLAGLDMATFRRLRALSDDTQAPE